MLPELNDWDAEDPDWWRSVNLIIVPRNGFPVPTMYVELNNIFIVGNNNLPMDGGGTLVTSDVHSSLVRNRMAKLGNSGNNGGSGGSGGGEGSGGSGARNSDDNGFSMADDGGWCIQGLVPIAVNGYIQRYHLYR